MATAKPTFWVYCFGLFLSALLLGGRVEAQVLCQANAAGSDSAIDEILSEIEAAKDSGERSNPDTAEKAAAIGNAFFRRWNEFSRTREIRPETHESYEEAVSALELDLEDDEVQAVLLRVNQILRHYLRWDSKTYEQTDRASQSVAEFLVQDDPQLIEFLDLPENDPRGLQEVLFLDLLQDRDSWSKINQLGDRLFQFRGRIELLLGDQKQSSITGDPNDTGLLAERYLQSLYRVETDDEGYLLMTADFPRLEDVNYFDDLFSEFLTEAYSIDILAPIFQDRLTRLYQELPVEKQRLSLALLLEGLEFDDAEIQRWQERKAIADQLAAGQESMRELQEEFEVTFNRSSYFRYDSSPRDHLNARLDQYRIQLQQFETASSLELAQSLNLENRIQQAEARLSNLFGKSATALQTPAVSGLHSEFRSLYQRLYQEVEQEFPDSSRSGPADYSKAPYANPQNFLPNHLQVRDEADQDLDGDREEWVINEKAVWSRDKRRWTTVYPPLRQGKYPPQKPVRERRASPKPRIINDHEFEVYREIAMHHEVWRRMQSLYSPGEGRIPLRQIVQEGKLYDESQFLETAQEKGGEWRDPILERNRSGGATYTDFEAEARNKYLLALDLLNTGDGAIRRSFQNPNGRFESIPIEYANLLTWKSEELALLKTIREMIPSYHLGAYQHTLDVTEKNQEIHPIDSSFRESHLEGWQKYQPGPLWYYRKNRLSNPVKDRTPLSLSAPDLDTFIRLALQIKKFEALMRRTVGQDVDFSFESVEAFEKTRDDFLALIEKKSQLVPGASLQALGCFESAEGSATNLTQGISETNLFEKAFRVGETTTATSAPLPLDTLKASFEACLQRYEDQKAKKASSLQEEFDYRASIVYFENASRLYQVTPVLKALAEGASEVPDLASPLKVPEDLSAAEIRARADQYFEQVFSDPENLSRMASLLALDAGELEAQGNQLFADYTRAVQDGLGHESGYFQRQLETIQFDPRFLPAPNQSAARQKALREAVASFQSQMQQSLERIRQPDFSQWSVLELDAALYLASAWGLDTNLFRNEATGVFDRYFNWFVTATDEGREMALDPRESFQLLRRATDLREGKIAAETIWGEDWQQRLIPQGEESALPEFLAEIRQDVSSVFQLLTRNQLTSLPYFLTYRDENKSFGVPPSLRETFEFSHTELEELKRYKIPTDVEHLYKLRQIGGKLAWQLITEQYLGSLSPDERSRKRREFSRRGDFPAQEVVEFIEEQQNFSGYRDRYKDLGLPHDEVDARKDPLDPFQKAFVARTLSRVEENTKQSVGASLRPFDLFWYDFFHQPNRQETAQVHRAFRSNANAPSEIRFLEFLGLDTDQNEVKKALQKIEKNNSALYSDLKKISALFFAEGEALRKRYNDGQGLAPRDIRRILLVMGENEDFGSRLLGRSGGSATAGYEVSPQEARLLLAQLGSPMPSGGLSRVVEDFTSIRKLLLYSTELFAKFPASLGQSVSRYIGLEILNTLEQDQEIQSELERFSQSATSIDVLTNRFRALDAYLERVGVEDRFSAEDLAAELAALDDQGQIDLDSLFNGLASFFEMWRNRRDPFHPLSRINEEDYQNRFVESRDFVFRDLPKTKAIDALRQSLPASYPAGFDPESEANKEIENRIFPTTEEGLLLTVYDEELRFFQSEIQGRIAESLDKRIQNLLLKDYRDNQTGEMRFLPFRDQLDQSDEKELTDDQLQAWQREGRQSILHYLDEQPLTFYATASREASQKALADKVFGGDYLALKTFLGEASFAQLDQALWNLLDAKNQLRLLDFYLEDYHWDEARLASYTAFAMKRYHDQIEETASNPEVASNLPALWFQTLSQEATIEAYLEAHPELAKNRESIFSSSSLRQQIRQQMLVLTRLDEVIAAAGDLGKQVDPESRRQQAVNALTSSMRDLIATEKTLPLTREQLFGGIETLAKDELEVKYEVLKQEREQRSRLDSSIWQPLRRGDVLGAVGNVGPSFANTLSDLRYMFGDGLSQMVAGGYRLTVENIGFNAWRLQGMVRGKEDEAVQQAMTFFGEKVPEWVEGADPYMEYISTKVNSQTLSNFHETRLDRDPTALWGDVIGDAASLYFLVSTFGGTSLIRTKPVEFVKTQVRAGSLKTRRAFYHSGGMIQRVRERALQRIRSKSPIRWTKRGLSIRPYRAKRITPNQSLQAASLLSASRRQMQTLYQNATSKEFRAGVLKKTRMDLAARLSALKEGAKTLTPALGSRIILDSLLLAGGAAVARQWAFKTEGGEALSNFGDDAIHGMQFIGLLMMSNILLGRMPMVGKTMHGALLNYIWTDIGRSGTQSLLVESAIFRDLINSVAWTIADDLRVEERAYEPYLRDYRYLDARGLPDAEAWQSLPDGEELLAQYYQDQQIQAQAISGLFILGIIYGSPYVGYRLDRHKFENSSRYEITQKPKMWDRRFWVNALNSAYGSRPQRYFDWAVQREFQILRQSRPLQGKTREAREKELIQMQKEAVKRAKENYSDTYEQLHPDVLIERLARHLVREQPKRAEAIRKQTRDELVLHYRRQAYQMDPYGDRILFRHRQRLQNENLETLLARFDAAWKRGQMQGDLARTKELKEMNRSKIEEHLQLYDAVSIRLAEFVKDFHAKRRDNPPTLLEVLREFGAERYWLSAEGQMVIRDFIIPRLKAAERGDRPYFGEVYLPGRDGVMTAERFSQLLKEAPKTNETPASRVLGQEIPAAETRQFYRRVPRDLKGGRIPRNPDSTRSEIIEVDVVRLNSQIERAVFPDRTSLLIYRAQPNQKRPSETLLLPEGWQVQSSQGSILRFRDKSRIETEIRFEEGRVYFYEVQNGRRASQPTHFFGNDPLTIEGFKNLLENFPGVLPTAVITTMSYLPREGSPAMAALGESGIQNRLEQIKLERVIEPLQRLENSRIQTYSSLKEIREARDRAMDLFSPSRSAAEIRSAEHQRLLAKQEVRRDLSSQEMLEATWGSPQYRRFLGEERLTIEQARQRLSNEVIEKVYRIERYLADVNRGTEIATEIIKARQLREARDRFGVEASSSREEIEKAFREETRVRLREFLSEARRGPTRDLEQVLSRQDLERLILDDALNTGARTFLGVRGGARFTSEQLQRGLTEAEQLKITDAQVQAGIKKSSYRDLLSIADEAKLFEVLRLENLESASISSVRSSPLSRLYFDLLEIQTRRQELLAE